MNTEKKTASAWRYVHGELDAEEHAAVETAMESDEELRDLVKEAQQMDGDLRELMPLTSLTEDDLEEQLLSTWEASQEERPTAKQETPILFLRPLLYGRFGVALSFAAALMVMFMASAHFNSEAIEWADSEIVPGQMYRGADGIDIPPTYTRDELANFSKALKSSVREHYEKSAPNTLKSILLGRKGDWVMSTRFQEFRNGKLGVQVKAYAGKGDELARQWNKYFTNSDIFLREVDSYGSQIAVELVTIRTVENGGT